MNFLIKQIHINNKLMIFLTNKFGNTIYVKKKIFNSKYRPQIFKNYLYTEEDDGIASRKVLYSSIYEFLN